MTTLSDAFDMDLQESAERALDSLQDAAPEAPSPGVAFSNHLAAGGQDRKTATFDSEEYGIAVLERTMRALCRHPRTELVGYFGKVGVYRVELRGCLDCCETVEIERTPGPAK
jgi:hypothetical protein